MKAQKIEGRFALDSKNGLPKTTKKTILFSQKRPQGKYLHYACIILKNNGKSSWKIFQTSILKRSSLCACFPRKISISKISVKTGTNQQNLENKNKKDSNDIFIRPTGKKKKYFKCPLINPISGDEDHFFAQVQGQRRIRPLHLAWQDKKKFFGRSVEKRLQTCQGQ